MVLVASALVAFAAALVFLWRRSLTYLHIFQQEEYDGRRFLRWLVTTGSGDPKLSLGRVALGIAAFFVETSYDWIVVVATSALFAVFAAIEADPRKAAKKKLVLTAR